MTQIKPFNTAAAGTTKYLCLQNVRLGYGIPAYYSTATKAWNGAIKHQDRSFPQGCDVPVFYTWYGTVDGVYANYGHVAVQLADGRVWTDGKYYANVDSLNQYYLGGKGTYLGWTEDLNNVRVVTEATMAETVNDDVSRQIGYHLLGRNGFDGRQNALQSRQNDLFGKALTNAQHSAWFLSPESRQWRDSTLPALYNERDTLRSTVAAKNEEIAKLNGVIANQKIELDKVTQALNSKQSEIEQLQDTVAKQNEQIVTLQSEVTKLNDQLANCGAPTEDTTMLDKLKESVNWFIGRIFKR
jgi:uncharacterized coiled-coil protein SlyX